MTLKMMMSMPNRPTAVYFADWLLALGGLKAAHELGVRVPEDLSIIGFDDTNMSDAAHPRLTAVCQDAVQLGVEAGVRLSRLVTGRSKEPFQITVPSFFEINESTGPAPANARLAGTAAALSVPSRETESEPDSLVTLGSQED